MWKVNPDGADPGTATATTPADATYVYDPVGNLLATRYRNGVETTNTFNTRNQLRRVRATKGTGSNPPQWANFDYDGAGELAAPGNDASWGTSVLSKSGQRNRMKENINGATRQVDYTYDKRRRLTLETIGSSSISYLGNGGTLSGYDAVGNRRSRIVNSVSAVAATPNNVAFDVNDRIDNDAITTTTSTRFDLTGNTTVADLNGDGTISTTNSDLNGDGILDPPENGYSYNYNNDNQLLTANGGGKTVTLSYDAQGNRVKKVVTGSGAGTVYFVVDDRNPTGYAQVIEERVTPSSTPTVFYVYGLDLIRQARGAEVRYFGYDGLGSVRYITDGTSGAVTDTYNYDAFGIKIGEWHAGTATVNNCLFAGEQWDNDLGMYYLRARYYQPYTGRFWTMDTYEGRQYDPLSLHKYLYCAADPVNRIDPSGNDSTLTSVMVGSAIGSSLAMARTYYVSNGQASAKDYLYSGLSGGIVGGAGGFFMPFVMAAGAGGKAFVLGVGAAAGFLQVGEDIEAGDVRAAQFDFVMTAGGVAVGMSGRTKAPIQVSRDAHERAVASFIRAAQQNGYEVIGTEIEVKVPNYARGRKYDVVLRNPVTKELGGIEIKELCSGV